MWVWVIAVVHILGVVVGVPLPHKVYEQKKRFYTYITNIWLMGLQKWPGQHGGARVGPQGTDQRLRIMPSVNRQLPARNTTVHLS